LILIVSPVKKLTYTENNLILQLTMAESTPTANANATANATAPAPVVEESITIFRDDLIECLSLSQKPFIVLHLKRYNVTKAEAEMFFNILNLLPLLFTKDQDSSKCLPLFEVISYSITNEPNKKQKFMTFAHAIGCHKMVGFLSDYFSL
jgi:hypothetical protein